MGMLENFMEESLHIITYVISWENYIDGILMSL